MAIVFKTTNRSDYSVLHFETGSVPLDPDVLRDLSPPEGLLKRRSLGLVLSGRGPVWLFGWLVHWAHPFAWVATFDPRLGGAVVVTRHVADGPEVGKIIKIDGEEEC